MRELRVVGILEEDGNLVVVLEDPQRRERFTVPGDERLRAAARGDLARLGQTAIEVGNELRPREIQTRIRAGATVAELAEAAGVPEQKIERFAYPVLLERSRAAELARLAHPVRADGPDPRTLAEVVADTFELRGQEYDAAVWDSWKGEDGRWVVTLSWTAGRSDNRAHWTFQPGASGGTVTPVDEHAHDLVEGLPARPLRPIGPVIDLAREEPGEPPDELSYRSEMARAVGEHVEHHRPDPAVAEPRRSGEPRAAEPRWTDPAASEPHPMDRRGEHPRAGRDDAPADTRSHEPTPTPPPRTPAPDEEPADETPAPVEPPAPATARRTKKGKPVMPSWDEVLLGVKGQR